MLRKFLHRSNRLGRLRRLWQQRNYYLANIFSVKVPLNNVAWMPDEFSIHHLGDTGLTIVGNFCSEQEAAEVIEAARDRLKRSGVFIDGRFQEHEGRVSSTAQLFGPEYRFEKLLPLMQRAAALTGLPYTHIETVYVTQYKEGGLYNEHVDYNDSFAADRLYTVLVYLNTVADDKGGATEFPSLKIAVQPRVGRALTWTNKNPDGSVHPEYVHAARPLGPDSEKWVLQFWFRRYPMLQPVENPELPQTRQGAPITAADSLPEGVRIV